MISSDFTPWWIPLFPLIGFLINAFFGFRLKKNAGWLATATVFASFAAACMMLMHMLAAPDGAKQHVYYLAPWLSVGSLQINWEMLIDPLSVTMMLIITGVGGLIHLYSNEYMGADANSPRFFTYLNLFVFFMLLLVMGNNFLMLFIGWEGVGLCSYLLIGYYYEKQSAGDAAKKAFIMNRIGDVGVLIGMFMLIEHFGTLDFVKGHAGVPGLTDAINVPLVAGGLASGIMTAICLWLFLGATGKSAQIPLYTWLPDAMEGPTPVSALIHAATMVTAGVYMVSRVHTLFEQSDDAMVVVCVIGVLTAILAATIGLAQNDIKRVLAYSTVSQLGYMFAACGAGVFAAGMFHVMTHAFFKACLFLGSGSVIHAVEHGMHAKASANGHQETAGEHDDHAGKAAEPQTAFAPDPHDPQDMRNMGGLASKTKITFVTMLVATLAISGIIPFAGYWSKDEILWRLFNDQYRHGQDVGIPAHIGMFVFGVGVITAFITAFYMFRMIMKTFAGKPRTDAAAHAHDPSWVITVPLIILAILASITGWIWMPFDKFQDWLSPSVVTPGYAPGLAPHATEIEIGGVVLGLIVLVVFACYWAYSKSPNGELLKADDRRKWSPYDFLLNKYYIDEANNIVWVAGGKRIAEALKRYDETLIDGIVNGVAKLTNWLGEQLRQLQTGYVRNYAFSMVIGILFVLFACIFGPKVGEAFAAAWRSI